MPREPILQPGVISEDDDRDLRPQRMRDMVGQRDVHERLGIAVDAASKRGEPLGHILLDGPPGLGKTTFATCIPRDLQVSCQIAAQEPPSAGDENPCQISTALPFRAFCTHCSSSSRLIIPSTSSSFALWEL